MIVGSAGNAYISRNNSSYFDPSLDFTKSFYIRTSRTPLVNVTSWLFGADIAYTPPYIWFGTSVASTDSFFFEFDTGSGAVDSSTFAVSHSTNVYVSLRYTKAAHTLELLFDGVVKDSKSANFDTFTAQPFDGMLNDGSSDDSTCSIAYERFYQRALSNTEILAEMASIVPVNSTMLLSSCPLQSSIDLTDHYQKYLAVYFPTSGTVITNTTDPLLSVVSGPPTNLTPADAITVTTDSAHFQDVNTGGLATDVWYKITAPNDGTVMLGVMSFGDLTTYKPSTAIYDGLANANADIVYLDITPGQNNPNQFPLITGHDFYFQSFHSGSVAASTLQFSVLKGLNLPVPVGSIAVNSDFSETPILALLDNTTGYPIKFVYPFTPVGEGGCPLANGITLLCMNENSKPNLYNSSLIKIAELNLPNYDRTSSNLTDTFIIGPITTSNAILKLVGSDGTINPTDFNVGATGVQSLGLNNDASLVYYSLTNATNQVIKSWNLLTNSAGSDLVAGVANYEDLKDIIVLQDTTILVPRWRPSNSDFLITRYNTSGSTLNTYDRDQGNRDDRIATAIDDPTSFWRWTKTSTRFNIWENIKTSDGSILSTRTQAQFDGTVLRIATATNAPVRFGNSESCPFWVTRTEIGPTVRNRSGIYYLTGTGSGNPTQRHDTLWIDASLGTTEDVKIP